MFHVHCVFMLVQLSCAIPTLADFDSSNCWNSWFCFPTFWFYL